MTPANFAKAIAVVESGDRSNPPLGDDGRALGRYQMHPDSSGSGRRISKQCLRLSETWDAYFTRLIQQYFGYRTGQGLTAIQAAVSFHVGHIVREDDPTWDAQYASDFTDAARGLA